MLRTSFHSQRPLSKLTGHQTCSAAKQTLHGSGAKDPRGSRQMDMLACPPGSLPAEIKRKEQRDMKNRKFDTLKNIGRKTNI